MGQDHVQRTAGRGAQHSQHVLVEEAPGDDARRLAAFFLEQGGAEQECTARGDPVAFRALAPLPGTHQGVGGGELLGREFLQAQRLARARVDHLEAEHTPLRVELDRHVQLHRQARKAAGVHCLAIDQARQVGVARLLEVGLLHGQHRLRTIEHREGGHVVELLEAVDEADVVEHAVDAHQRRHREEEHERDLAAQGHRRLQAAGRS